MTVAFASGRRTDRSTRVALTRIELRDFRNIAAAEVAPHSDGFCVVGENGHGKTNLLEAVHYLQILRSARGARDQDVVRFGCDGFHIAGEALLPHRREVTVGFEIAGNRKRIRVDGEVIAKLSDAAGMLPSVMFSPRDLELVAGDPSQRRRYLDMVLALSSRKYLAALREYRAALVRRNAVLRAADSRGGRDAMAAAWEPALAENGGVLWSERVRWVGEMAGRFAELCCAIGEVGAPQMRYRPAIRDGGAPADALRDALESRRELDLRRGFTHSGPHRDELDLTLNGRDLRSFGSAGQQRTVAIALRMLEAATLQVAGGADPVLLLDDPFAELDERRSRRILDLLGAESAGQVIVAVPRAEEIPPHFTRLERWAIRDGDLSRQES